MPTVLLPSQDNINRAVEVLRSGGVVGFPTETVYGLGGSTFDTTAIERIYEVKGRPADNPLIAHVLDSVSASRLTSVWDDRCQQLAEHFWPGPLTLIVPRAPDVPAGAAGGRDTIAVRSPQHPVARDLLQAIGGAISAPSANRSGHVSPTSAAHVADDYGDVDDLLILDGGSCGVGIESTVLDMTGAIPAILRRGSVSRQQLEEVLAQVEVVDALRQAASPGTSLRHYAPRTPARLMSPEELAYVDPDKPGCQRVALLGTEQTVGRLGSLPCIVWHRAMPRDDVHYAAGLYGALRAADDAGAESIWIERPPANSNLWQAIHDRLNRATQA